MQENEIEVFRIVPKVGKFYYTAKYTHKTGVYPNEKYFTVKPLHFVGSYVKELRYGWGDGGLVKAVFNNKGTEIVVDYDYDGTVCFIETSDKSLLPCKELIQASINRIPSLKNYVLNQLSSNELSEVKNILSTYAE